MIHDFDAPIDRRGTAAKKWDGMAEEFGIDAADAIPLWVADMDFRPPPKVNEAPHAAADHGVHGYYGPEGALADATVGWMARRHQWDVDPESIITTHGTVAGMHFAVQALSEPGDAVVVPTPIYFPLRWAVERNDRIEQPWPMDVVDGRYRMDIDRLRGIITDKTRLLMLCSPLNPGGTVWGRDELTALGELCVEHDIKILSDEVHHDLVYGPHRHIPTAALSPEISAITLTLASASKTFNLAGAKTGNVIISDAGMREAYRSAQSRSGVFGVNRFGTSMTIAAYRHGDEWLDQLLGYLTENRDLVDKRVAEISGIESMSLEGTYLAWLDYTATGFGTDEALRRTEQVARLAMTPGEKFGPGGEHHLRLNFACRRAVLTEALDRLMAAFAD